MTMIYTTSDLPMFGVAIKACGRCGVLYVSHVMRDSLVLPVDNQQGHKPSFNDDDKSEAQECD